MTNIALFPGVFDPPTLGHMDIIKRAPLLCEKLIVAVAHNPTKTPFFSLEERLAMLRSATHNYPYVEVASFSEMAVEYAIKRKVRFLLRGLRTPSDFERETQMAVLNRKFSGVETVFLTAQYSHISSSLIREIAFFGGPLYDLVPPEVEITLQKKFHPHK